MRYKTVSKSTGSIGYLILRLQVTHLYHSYFSCYVEHRPSLLQLYSHKKANLMRFWVYFICLYGLAPVRNCQQFFYGNRFDNGKLSSSSFFPISSYLWTATKPTKLKTAETPLPSSFATFNRLSHPYQKAMPICLLPFSEIYMLTFSNMDILIIIKQT